MNNLTKIILVVCFFAMGIFFAQSQSAGINSSNDKNLMALCGNSMSRQDQSNLNPAYFNGAGNPGGVPGMPPAFTHPGAGGVMNPASMPRMPGSMPGMPGS